MTAGALQSADRLQDAKVAINNPERHGAAPLPSPVTLSYSVSISQWVIIIFNRPRENAKMRHTFKNKTNLFVLHIKSAEKKIQMVVESELSAIMLAISTTFLILFFFAYIE